MRPSNSFCIKRCRVAKLTVVRISCDGKKKKRIFSTMPTKKKQAGIGATGSCYAKFVHPSEFMRQLYPHNPKAKLEGFIITGEAMKVVRRRTPPKPCFLFRHDSIPEHFLNQKDASNQKDGSNRRMDQIDRGGDRLMMNGTNGIER